MAKNKPLSITNPELDLHQSGVVVFRGTGPSGARLDFSFAGRSPVQRTINAQGTWEVKMRVPDGRRRLEAIATASGGTTDSVRRSVHFMTAKDTAALATPSEDHDAPDRGRPPILSHARLGIGVTDPEWWKLRYETLRHIMIPSLVNAHVPGHRLLLAVDTAVAQDVLEELKSIIVDCGAGGFADIVFTDSVWAYPQTVENHLHLHFGDIPVIMHGIDDDDAVYRDFFRVARAKVAEEDPSSTQLHTFPFGLMYNIELHRVQLGIFPWHSMNQFAYGRPELIHTLRAHSHNRIQIEGEKRGWTVREHQDLRLAYLYTHHKQSDSGYVKRLETMRLNDQSFPLAEPQATHFGIHLENLRDLSTRIGDMPAVTGRTWLTSTQYQDAERNLLRASESLKEIRLKATREIVERETRKVPVPQLEVELAVDGDPSLVRFSGRYPRDHFVRIRVDGTDLTSLFLSPPGTWNYPLRLQPGEHVVELVGVSPQARTSDSTATTFVVAATTKDG